MKNPLFKFETQIFLLPMVSHIEKTEKYCKIFNTAGGAATYSDGSPDKINEFMAALEKALTEWYK